MPEIHLDVPPHRAQAYLAEPTTVPPPWPGVVLLHELFGVNDDIRAKADRFASRGYVALAPDLLTLSRPKALCVLGVFRALNARKGPAFDAIEAARADLAGRDTCTGRVGVIGFCLGGGFAVLSAPRFDFAAAAVNYGQVPKDAPDVLKGACPVVASYGAKDLPLRGTAQRLERALEAAGVEHDVKEYPDASHSFLTQYDGVTGAFSKVTGIGFHAPSADDAWRRIDAFFERHLKAA
jgi:carboxymethylenebutenolidase